MTRDLAILFIHLIVTVVRLFGPGGDSVCVLDFAKQLNTRERDPLHLLNTFLANSTGLIEKDHFDLMTRTSKGLMRKIESQLST